MLVFYDKDWQKNIEGDDYVTVIFDKLTPLVAHASLTPFIEAYRIVSDNLARLDAMQRWDEQEMLDLSFKYGKQLYLQRRISSRASMGKMLFTNAYKLLDSYGLVEAVQEPSDKNELTKKRKKMSRDLRLLSDRLEKIRVMAIPNYIDRL